MKQACAIGWRSSFLELVDVSLELSRKVGHTDQAAGQEPGV